MRRSCASRNSHEQRNLRITATRRQHRSCRLSSNRRSPCSDIRRSRPKDRTHDHVSRSLDRRRTTLRRKESFSSKLEGTSYPRLRHRAKTEAPRTASRRTRFDVLIVMPNWRGTLARSSPPFLSRKHPPVTENGPSNIAVATFTAGCTILLRLEAHPTLRFDYPSARRVEFSRLLDGYVIFSETEAIGFVYEDCFAALSPIIDPTGAHNVPQQ